MLTQKNRLFIMFFTRHFIIALFSILPSAVQTLAAAPTTEPTHFIRYVENADGSSRLEAAEATYKNDAGVVVHLIGAVHIADPDFFTGLNESFDHYDALLYELVTSGDGPPIPSTQRSKESSLAWVGNLQRFMRDHLDLVFQLDAIDYDRPNFVHADLDAETFAALQANRGESMFTLMMRLALQNMSKAEKKGPDLSGIQLIGTVQSESIARAQARARRAVRRSGRRHGRDGRARWLGDRRRTKQGRALCPVKEQIAHGKKYLGIFYGAGHLRLMEKSLGEMGFKKIGVTWRTRVGYRATGEQPAHDSVGKMMTSDFAHSRRKRHRIATSKR